MAKPRQRRKAKSGTHRAVSHSKRAKRLQKKMPAIRGPKVLQDAWDSTKTIRQNYLALGLEHDLNPISSGGSEVSLVRTTDQIDTSQRYPSDSSPRIDDATRSPVSEELAVSSAPPKGFGRIIRDSSGNVVRVELPSDEDAGSTRELAIDAPAAAKEPELRRWVNDRPETRRESDSKRAIVRDLESFAASATVHQRHTSSGERACLGRLVDKYGDELERMARDRRLNPGQRTANELRRAIAKAGGGQVLCRRAGGGVAE